MPLMVWDMDDLIHNIEKMYADLDDEILKDIARRINKMGFVTSSAELQAQIAVNSGLIYQDILDRVSALTGKTRAELDLAFKKGGVLAVKYDDAIYKAAGLDPISLNLSPAMQQTLVAGLEKTAGVMENLAMSMPNAGQKAYLDAVDSMYMKVSSGAFSYTEALRTGLKEMAAKGLKVVKYTGKTDQIDVAMRRALLTGISQTANRIQIDHAYEMGSDLVEVSAHIGARPSHAVWQGQVYSLSGGNPKYKNFVTETHYGEGDGLGGWNCRHSFYPFFEGLSDPNYSIKELNDYDRMRLNYNGEDMSFYEGTQKQREIERSIRKWKRQADTLGAGGADNTFELGRVRQYQAQMRDFIKQTGLVRQPTREGGSVTRVVVPGFRMPKWVPGMGAPTPISKISTTGLGKVLPPPPWVKPPLPPAPPKKLVIKPAGAPAWDLKTAEEAVINKYKNVPWQNLPSEQFQLYHAVLNHFTNDPLNPDYYKLIYRLDKNGNIVAATSYYKSGAFYKLSHMGSLKPGAGKSMFKELLEKCMVDGLGFNTPRINSIKGQQFFKHFGLTMQAGERFEIKFTDLPKKYISIFGQGEYDNFKLVNAGKFKVPLVTNPPPPVAPLSSSALNQKQKDDLFRALEAKELAGNLNDPDELVMYGALGDEKGGVHKLLAKFSQAGDIQTMIVYDDSPKQLTLVKVLGYTDSQRKVAIQEFFEKALLEHKGVDGQLRKLEKDLFKQLKIPVDPTGAIIFKPNQIKGIYIQAWGDIDFKRFEFKNPNWKALADPKAKKPQVGPLKKGGKFLPAPQGAPPNPDSCNNWVRVFPQDEPWITSKDGKIRFEPSKIQPGVGMFDKVVVEVYDGKTTKRYLLKPDFTSQGYWGIKRGFAHREVVASEIDQLLKTGVVPKTHYIIDEKGEYRSLQIWIDGTKMGDRACYLAGDSQKFVENVMPDQEEVGKMCLIDMITGNTDRHNQNWIADAQNHIYAIDNGLSLTSTQNLNATYNQYGSNLIAWVTNKNNQVLLNPKYRAALEKAINDGSLERVLREGVKSDNATVSANGLKAAMKRARDLVADWDVYFYWP